MKPRSLVPLDRPNLVRHDLNFLEHLLWRTDHKDKRYRWEIEGTNGNFIYEAKPDKVPDASDALFLLYFLFLSQKTDKTEFTFRTYDVLKDLKMPINQQYYERIEKMLERWSGVSITFDGCFYEVLKKKVKKNGEETEVYERRRVKKFFNIWEAEVIQSDIIERTTDGQEKEVQLSRKKHLFKIHFYDNFINSIQKSLFFKDLNLTVYIQLKRPLARRLYEWLPKQFLKQEVFSIGHPKLFAKMGIVEADYPSVIQRKLKSIQTALKQVNKFEPQYEYKINWRKKRNEFIVNFTRTETGGTNSIENQMSLFNGVSLPDNSEDDIDIKLKSIQFNNREEIRKLHSNEVLENALADLEFNVERQRNTKRPIENPAAWFNSRLPEPGQPYEFTGYYEDYLEEKAKREKLAKIRAAQRAQEIKERDEKEKEREIREKAKELYQGLTTAEQNKIKDKAIQTLTKRNIFKEKERFYDTLLNMEIWNVVAEEYKIGKI